MKKFTFLLVIISLTLFKNADAQWSQIGWMVSGTVDSVTTVNAFEGFGTNLYAATNKGIFKSTDNGDNWSSISYAVAVTQTLTMMSVYEESVSIIYAGSDKRLFKSTNSGTSWTWLPLPKDTISITDIRRSGNNIVVSYNKSFSSGGVFYSNNNGATWSSSTGIPSANNMSDLHVEGDTVYAAGKGGIYKSSDNGASFTFLANGINVGLASINRHKGNLIAGDIGGSGFYLSTNNGATFTQANTTVFAGFCQVFSITQSPSAVLAAVDGPAACAASGSTAIKVSYDGGTNWSTFMTGLTPGFHPEVGTNANQTSFFTHKGKKTFRTSAVMGIKEYHPSDNVKAFFDSENVLNIFVPNTTSIDLRIYSVAGSLLYENIFSDSEIKIKEMENMPAGIYIITMTDGKKSLSKKVIKQE